MHSVKIFSGLSTDTKPTAGVALSGSIFIEQDTTRAFVLNGIYWLEMSNYVSTSVQRRIYNAVTLPGTLTPEIDHYDYFNISDQAETIGVSNHIISTPTQFQRMYIRIMDNGTPQQITWDSNYFAVVPAVLPASTSSKLHEFVWIGEIPNGYLNLYYNNPLVDPIENYWQYVD